MLRETVFSTVPRSLLEEAIAKIDDLARSPDDPYFDEIVALYGRVQRFETRYLVDAAAPFSQVLEQYKPDGTLLTSYVFGNGPISQTQGGQQQVFITDAIGSVRGLTGPTGAVTDRFTGGNSSGVASIC